MKYIALYIGGRSTCFYQNLIMQLENESKKNIELEIHVFASLNEDPNTEHSKRFETMIKPKKIRYEQFKCPEYILNHRNRYWHTRPYNFASMYYNNFKAFELIEEYMKETGIKYDMVIKYRTDIVREENDLPIPDEDIKENSVYTLFDHNWDGGLNDQIGVGTFETMKLYSNLYNQLKEYLIQDNTVMHPETLLRHHLTKHNVNLINLESWKYGINENRYKYN
jgi:hypothetical protein